MADPKIVRFPKSNTVAVTPTGALHLTPFKGYDVYAHPGIEGVPEFKGPDGWNLFKGKCEGGCPIDWHGHLRPDNTKFLWEKVTVAHKSGGDDPDHAIYGLLGTLYKVPIGTTIYIADEWHGWFVEEGAVLTLVNKYEEAQKLVFPEDPTTRIVPSQLTNAQKDGTFKGTPLVKPTTAEIAELSIVGTDLAAT